MYNLGNSSPVVNPGYYDVPIYNQYSNPIRGGNEKKISNYQFNTTVGNTINDNNDNYEVYETPTTPSPSLYIEQNLPMSGFQYGNNISRYNNVIPEKNKFYNKQIPGDYVPPSVVEGFENYIENFDGSIQNNINTGSESSIIKQNIPIQRIQKQPVSVIADGGRRDGQNTIGYQQTVRNQQLSQFQKKPHNNQVIHYPQKPAYNRNNNYYPSRRNPDYYPQYYNNYVPFDYINIRTIPNIAGFYDNKDIYIYDDIYEDNINDNYEQSQEKPKVVELKDIKQNNNELSNNIDNNKYDVNKDDKLENSDLLILKKKKKKKKINPIYLVIFLLIILIILVLYFIIKNKKRVRF